MPRRGRRQWVLHFCLGISCSRSRGSRKEVELLSSERNATENNGAATGPLPTPAPNPPPILRVDSPRETCPENGSTYDPSIIAGRQTSEKNLPPLPPSRSSLASFATLKSQISRATSLGSHDSQKDAGLSGDQRSGIGPNGAAKGLLSVPVLGLPPSAPVDSPGEAGSERDSVGDTPTTAESQKQEARPSPSLKSPGPSFVSPPSLKSHVSYAHSSVEDDHEPVNAELPIVAVEDVPPHALDNTNLSQPVAKVGKKKKAIAFAKATLHVVAAGLKAAPIPNLDQIPNILLALIHTYETIDGNNERLQDLCDLIGRVKDTLLQPLQCLDGGMPPEVDRVVNVLQSELTLQLQNIDLLRKEKAGSKLLLASAIAAEISATEASIANAIQHFTAAASIANLKENVQRRIDYALAKLPVAVAEHTSGTKKPCFETTRADIRNSIMQLLNDHSNRFVWLQGSPGTGKTAIAKSIAHSLAEEKRLAASFFWDKTGVRTNTNTVELFPSTLASQLATFCQDYETLLVNRLLDRTSRNILNLPLEKRMDLLVINSMNSISKIFTLEECQPVVVLDGLDECGDHNALAQLMELVLLLDNLPPNFTILVSSRSEPEIRDAWESSHNIVRVYTDKIMKNDTDHTIGEMVKVGLGNIPQSHHLDWTPSKGELHAFIKTCRQLPLLAEIRIREVKSLARTHTLQRAFHRVRDDAAVPTDLNGEYLRILRRAYLGTHPDVLRTYRDAIGTVIAAHEPLSVATISDILNISRGDIIAALDPVCSIIYAPASSDDPVHFYHATMKEFLAGSPQGDKGDHAFFISDVKGAFLALPLLKVLNYKGNLNRNMTNTKTKILLSNRPTSFSGPSLPDIGGLLSEKPRHVAYAVMHWSTHLDLSSASKELFGELRLFLTTKLLFWIELLVNPVSPLQAVLEQEKSFVGINADLPRLLRDAIAVCKDPRFKLDRRHMYRSILPFLPPSSPVFTHYNKLSDLRVYRIEGNDYNVHLPSYVTPQNKVRKAIPITCTALSDDGRQVALGFRGGVKVVDAERGVVTSRFRDESPYPLVWLLFTNNGRRLVTENTNGDIYILDNITSRRQLLSSRPDGAKKVMSSLSHDGSMIARVAQRPGTEWYGNMGIIRISTGFPTINALATPHPDPPIPHDNKNPRFPLRRSLGFSPDGRYVAAFDTQQAFVWSSSSFQVVSQHSVNDPRIWFLNTNRPSAASPAQLSDQPVVRDPPGPTVSSSCVLLTLPRQSDRNSEREARPAMEMISRITGMAPMLLSRGGIWLRGRGIVIISSQYRDPKSCSVKLPFQSSRFFESIIDLTFPTSRDGMRFLICDEEGSPLVIDVSRLIATNLAA